MEAARQRGVHIGRPRKLSHVQITHAQNLLQGQPDITPAQIANQFDVSPRTIYRALSQSANNEEGLIVNAG